MSDSVSRFDFDEYKALVDSELRAVRALALRKPQVIKGDPGTPGRDGVVDARAVDLKLQTIAFPKLVELLSTVKMPKDGEPGKDGIGKQGEPGLRGPPGQMGPMPEHKWIDETKLAFEHPDGTFDDPPIELRGPPGKDGGGSNVGLGGIVIQQGYSYFPAGWT